IRAGCGAIRVPAGAPDPSPCRSSAGDPAAGVGQGVHRCRIDSATITVSRRQGRTQWGPKESRGKPYYAF
ncbi:MAG TPA: hypothetical protein VGS41_09515, partial [Chthonomonadales bacterium]|nr:hypothetical protein [Chthonomonadales bacterium]